jgi:hypothetical protein
MVSNRMSLTERVPVLRHACVQCSVVCRVRTGPECDEGKSNG